MIRRASVLKYPQHLVSVQVEMAECEAFIVAPSEEASYKCTKEQLLNLGEHYSVVVVGF